MMITDPYELLRVMRDEHFIDVPSSYATHQRARCNEVIQSANSILEAYDTRVARSMTDAHLGTVLRTSPTPILQAEAARRLGAPELGPEPPIEGADHVDG